MPRYRPMELWDRGGASHRQSARDDSDNERLQVYHEKSMVLPDVSRVLACLYEKDIKFETHTASYKSLLRLQASSHAPVPFYDGPTTFLEDSREICRYIAEKYEHHGYPFLLGKDALERASVEQWLHNEEHAFNPPSRALFCHLAFPLNEEDDGDDISMHTRKLEEVLEVYEQRLSDSEFLAGNKFTLADLVHLPNSHYIKASNKFLYLYDSRKNVRRWWDAISCRDSWKKVLSYMESVKEQNKQEELKRQQQKEDPTTSSHPIRIDSRKQIGTESKTILVSPADTVSSFVKPTPQKPSKPLNTFSESKIDTGNTKISSIAAKEVPDQSSASNSYKSDSRATGVDSQFKKVVTYSGLTPPELEPTDTSASKLDTTDVHHRLQAEHWHAATTGLNDIKQDANHLMSTGQGKLRNDLQQYKSQDSEQATSYPVPQEPMSMELVQGREKITQRPYNDQSPLPQQDSEQATSHPVPQEPMSMELVQGREKITRRPYTDQSPLPQQDSEQATSHPVPQEPMSMKLVQGREKITRRPYTDQSPLPQQDSEQATSHPVPQEPMSMELVQGREKITRRPYTDQSGDVLSPLPQQSADVQEIVEDHASSGKRGAVPSPSRQAADKDAQSMIPSQAEYPGGQSTIKQHRDRGSMSTQRAVQDARVTFDEPKASYSTISNERFSYASQSSRQDLDGTHHSTAPSEKRYPGTEDTSKQAKDKSSTPSQMTDQSAEYTTEETKISESSSSRVQHSYVQRPDASSRKQEKFEDPHSATSAIQRKYANVKDTSGLSRDTAFKPMQTIGQDYQDTFRETKPGDPSFLRDQQPGTWQTVSSSTEHEVNQAPPSQTRYQSSTPPSKTSYPVTKDASKHPRGTASTPKKKAAQDDVDTSEESNTAEEVASTEQPLNAWRAPVSPRRQEVEDSSRANTSFQKRYPHDEDIQVAETASAPWQIAPDGGIEETKLVDSTPISAKAMYTQPSSLPPRQAKVEDANDKGRQSRVTIPEPHKMVSTDAQATHEDTKADTPGQQSSDHVQASRQRTPAAAKGRDDLSAEGPFKKDITNDQTVVPPLFSNEPTSQVQTTESLQEATSRGGFPVKPSTIEQWQRTSVPLNDVTSSSAGDKIGMATIDQKLAPMSQQGTPSADGVNWMAKESGEQRVEPPVPIEAETSGVPSVSSSLPGPSTAHRPPSVERVGEPTKIASSPDSSPAHLKRATPDGQEIGDSELVRTADGQISEAAKTRHDEATLHEDVHDANLTTHYMNKDAFKVTKVAADSTPHSAKSMYTQQSAPTPRHAEAEDIRDKGTKSRETIPDLHKMVERRAGTAGEQVLDRRKAIPPSSQAAAEDAHGATGDTIQSPDILETSKKSRGTYEEAKGPGSTLSKAQSLGAQYAQRNTGESTAPTAGQRKEVSAKPQPDVKDGLEEAKLSAADWNGWRSLSSEGKDGLDTETTIMEEKSPSTGQLRETHKKSESTTPKAHPIDFQRSVEEEKAPSIYQKKPLVAKDSQERAQTIPAGENADGSTPKHPQDSDALNTSDEKLNASELPRAKSHGGFSIEDPYRGDTTDGQKVAPPLLSQEPTSQDQPPSEPSHDTAFHGNLSSEPSTIDQWRRASVPLHDVTPSSVDDNMAISTVDEKLTPRSQQESSEQIMEPPVPLGAETSGVQPASPSFPGASVDDHATISDEFAKQPIIDERVGESIQMRTSSPDAHPSSEPTKRAFVKGHQISDLEHVSTPDRQISEAKKARDGPAIVHEDVYDVNLSTHDMGKDTFKETKVGDSTPSSAKSMHIQQPALTPSRQTQVEEDRDKTLQSRETIPEQQKTVERKTGMSGEQSPDHQKAIRPSRKLAAENASTGDIRSPDILDTSKKSRGIFEEGMGPGSALHKAQASDAQDSELTKGKYTIPTADQRKDWKDAKDDVTEEKSFSTERLKDMFQESESTTPKTQPTDSQGSSMEKTSSIYQKGPLPAQDSQDETQIIPSGDKVDSSTPVHQESLGAPYTYNEKLSASAPARADIHDYHSAEKPYKKYTADDQKVDLSISGKEPAHQVQPSSEALQRTVPDGDLPSKSFTIDQWQRASAPLHGVITDSGDAEVAMSSNNDQKSRPKSQEANLSSQRVSQMAKQSGEQRIKPSVPIGEETSDVGLAATSLPVGARTDDAIINDKFTKQSNVDERVGEPKQMQTTDKAAHPVSAPTKRILDGHEAGELVSSSEGPTLEDVKATQGPATIPEDVHDASVSANDTYEKEARYNASGDELLRGSLHDQQAQPPASGQAHPTVETPHDSDSSQYLHTADLGKLELAKPTVIGQGATAPIADPTSMDPHRAGILPAEVAHSEQKSAPSDNKGSPLAAQSLTSQMSFRQQARPSPPSTIGIPASDTQGVIGKIQEATPDDRPTDDSGKQFVPSQEQISHSSQVIPGKEEMAYPPSTRVFPTSDTQLASAEVHEVTPDDQHDLQSITPLVSSKKQGSYVGSAFESGEVGPAEKEVAPSDQELHHSAEQHGEPRKEQTVVPTAEQIKAQMTIIGRQEIADNRKESLTSEDVLDTTPTHGNHPTGSIEPARKPLSVEGDEPTSATQEPSHTEDTSAELENVRSMKPSTTPDARDITSSSTLREVVFPEQQSSPPGQGSADPAKPTFSLGPRNEDIRDIASSAPLLSSTDPRQGDAIVAEPDQAKDSQKTPRQQDILSTQHPSIKVQEDIPGGDSGEANPLRPSSAVREGKSSDVVPALAPGIQLGSVPNEVTLDEQKFAPSGQDSSYPAQSPSADPRSKEIGDLSPSTQLNYTTEPRNGDAIVAALGQAKDSQETPRGQFKLSALSSYTQLPSGKPQEDEPADNLGEVRSSKLSSVEEDRSVAAVPLSAPDAQHGAAQDEVTVDEHKFAPSGQGSSHTTFTAPVPDTQSDKEDVDKQKVAPSGQQSVHSVQPSFTTGPTQDNTVADAADQTSTLEKTPRKTPFSGTPYASRKTQKGTDDDHIGEKLPSQWRVSPDRHVSESPKGLTPEAHIDVDKKATPGSSQAETSNNVPDSTIYGDSRLRSSNVPAESSLPETQDLQGSASAQNAPADPLGNIESPTYLSTDQVMAPKMSPTIPSVAPLGTVPGTNSVQTPQQASTVDLESAPGTQPGMPQGRANPAEQKFTISDQEPAHISEPRKEEGNAAAGDQPNVPQGPETTDQHHVKAPSPDAREPLQKDRQPSHAVLPSDLHGGRTSEVNSAVFDKETPLMLSQDQTSADKRNSTLTSGDVLPKRSLKKQEAEPPAATQAPTSRVLQSSALAQNDSLGNIESPRQASADQVMVPAINSAATSDAPQVTEPGRNSSQPLQPPFSTETTKEDTVVTADDQAKDMKTITHQQAITPAPGTAKTPFPSTQDASRTIQESTDDGPIDELLPSQEQVSLLGSNSELREGQTADPYGTHVDEKTTKSPSSQANISDSESGLARALGDVVPSTGEGLAKISSPERGERTQLPAATQDVSPDASTSSKAKSIDQRAKAPTRYPASSLEAQPGSSQTQGVAAPGEQNFAVSDKEYANASKSVPSTESRKEKTNAANVDQISVPHTTVTHQVTSSTPDASEDESSHNDDDIRNLADPLIANQEEDTTVAAADQAEGMQTIAHQQAISPAPGASKTPERSIQDASRIIQESTADDGHVDEPLPIQEQVSLQTGKNIDEATTFPSSQATISDLGSGLAPAKFSFPEPGEQTQMPAETEDVSLEASNKAKSTGQGAMALAGDPASVLDTQPDSSQTRGEAATAEQKFVVTDKESANASKSPFSAEPREEQTNVATADQRGLPETTITNQATSAKPDGSDDTLEKDHESSRDDDHISNSANLVVSEEAASGRASEESSDAIDKKMNLPFSETQTSSTGTDSTLNSSENTKDVPKLTEDASGDVQSVSKSEVSSRSSEESKVLQSEDNNQGGETESPSSEFGHPSGRGLAEISDQNNSSHSQAAVPDKSVEQSSPDFQNKGKLDGSADPTKPGYMKD